jgi:glucose dehydrogenase
LLFIVLGIALLVGAIGLFRSSPAGNPAKWALLPAALFQTADLVLLFSRHGGEWWTLACLGALYVLAGVILATYSGRPQYSPEAPGITDATSSPQ